ncbi:MAG: S41 family peptidase [Gemmatimonadaceae bacterium]
MTRFKKAALATAVIAPLVTGAFVLQDRGAADGGRLFGQVLDLVQHRFVDSVQSPDLYEKAARGLVSQLQDPYSELLTPKQLSEFTKNTGGRYGGIGMQIEEQPGKGVIVSKVFPGTPAEQAGIREGDLIVGIDSIGTRGWTSRRVSEGITGVPGTKVHVSFARPGVAEPIRATFSRAIIHVPAVRHALIYDNDIGYIKVDGFNETASREVSAAIRRLTSDGMKGLVLDLRSNPGGYLEQALEMSNLFLSQGQEIVSVRGRNVEPQIYVARQRPIAPSLPLVILTDQFTASASEIVAGALQDHDRALIIGTTSFGKGLVQTLFNLEGGYALKMTTQKWYTPSGRSIQRERKSGQDAQIAEVLDTIETDSARRARPQFRSDGGRVVYGGGAITPDLVVRPDTFTTAEQEFRKTVAPKNQEMYVVRYDLALELKPQVTKDFSVKPEWRDEYLRRMQSKGIDIDRSSYNAVPRYIDRLLEQSIARVTFGDSTAHRRTLADDVQLRTALDLLRKGQTQRDLFALASPTKR